MERCGYASKPYWNSRAVKPSGERHKLSEEHGELTNRCQRRLGERAVGAGGVSARQSPVSPVAPAESQLRPIRPADGFRLRSSVSTLSPSACPSASASRSQPKTVKVSQVLAQMQRDVAGERTAKRPRRSDRADTGSSQASGIDTPVLKTVDSVPLHESAPGTETEPVPVDDSTPCVAISSRQWFPANKRKRVCAVCRYETRKPTVVTDFCRAHGVSLCSRVYSSAASGPGMCLDTRWTCWTKFHRFYQPAGVFSAKGNVRRSSPLVKLRYAHLRSQGQAVDDELDEEQE